MTSDTAKSHEPEPTPATQSSNPQDSNQRATQQTSQSKPPLITRTFVVAWLINFSMYLVFYLLVTIMALYAVKEFAASDAAGGFASSSFVVGATLARLVSGWLVDSLGGRKMMFGALAAIVLACAAYLVAGSLTAVFAVRIIHGLAYALASTAVMALAQGAIPASRRAEGTGYFALGTTLATAFGPALGLALSGSFGYDMLFFVSLGLAIIALALAFILPKPTGKPILKGNKRGISLSDIMHPNVVPIGVFMLFVGLAYAGVITFLNGYSEAANLTTGAGFFFVAYAIAMMAARYFLGRLQDTKGDNPVIGIGVVCHVIALVLLGAATVDWMIILAGVFCGLGYGTLMPACQAISVRLAPANKIGAGISTLMLLADVGIGLGPIFLGIIVSSAGFSVMYYLLAALTLAAGIFYFFIHGRHPKSKPHHVELD